MIIDIPGADMLRWVADHLREAPGALAGGFLAYVMHELFHVVWKKPGHLLTRRIFRRRRQHH